MVYELKYRFSWWFNYMVVSVATLGNTGQWKLSVQGGECIKSDQS